MVRHSVAIVCVILLTGAAVATTQAVREGSKCGDETLIWKPCKDKTKACYETSYKGNRRARVVPDGFFARSALLLQAG